MVLVLLILMIGVPILEIAVFIQAGEAFGLWPTLGAVILTAVIGSAMLRHQGLSILARAQKSLAAGEAPIAEVFDGVCLVVGGALLLTPGFVTDTVGFLLLVPAIRRYARNWFLWYLASSGRVHVWTSGQGPAPGGGPSPGNAGPGGRSPGGKSSGGTVIDGDFEVIDDEAPAEKEPGRDDRNLGKSRWGKPEK